MKNILLVLTGGTIGSKVEQGTIDTDADAGLKLLELFRQHHAAHREITFDIISPLQILSENLHPNAWQILIDAIQNQDLERYDGIIVTHGTDTLAFSAALLGIYFNALDLPLLMVSSNLPLDNPQANGLPNFITAVEFIRQNTTKGVFVAYRNPGQATHIHIGTRLSTCLPLSGDFISIQFQPWMTFSDGHFITQYPLTKQFPHRMSFEPRFARILLIHPYPGLDYSQFNIKNVDVILHDLYHSGTACVSSQWGENHQLLHFAEHCRHHGVPLYLAPAILSETAYDSTRQLLNHGVQMIWNTSLESAHAKLILAYGNQLPPKAITALLTQDLAHECIAPITIES